MTEFPTQRKDEQGAPVNSEVNKNLVQTSEAIAQDIMLTMRRKVGGKRIHVDITYAHMDNVSFHSETRVQKWKCILQRRISIERELGEGTLDYKEIRKVYELMKTFINDGHNNEERVMDFKKVFDRRKYVKLSNSIFN